MTPGESISVGAAAIKLSNKVLGDTTEDLVDILKELASEAGLSHISYLRMSLNKSLDSSTLTAITTYSKEWERRYFYKQYFLIDSILRYGRDACSPFDWKNLVDGRDDLVDFIADAKRYNLGRNGFSIPVRNRKHSCAVVPFTNNLSKDDWEKFKAGNMTRLRHLSVLIDAAATIGAKLPDPPSVSLSLREEQCLMWAARG